MFCKKRLGGKFQQGEGNWVSFTTFFCFLTFDMTKSFDDRKDQKRTISASLHFVSWAFRVAKNTLQTSVKFDGSHTLSFTDILQITQSDENFDLIIVWGAVEIIKLIERML